MSRLCEVRLKRLEPTIITKKNRVVRSVWGMVWLLLYRPSPKFMHWWRCLLLRAFGAKLGRGVHPYPSSKVWAPWNLQMGDGSCLADWVDCYNVAKISIGANATISQYSFLCTASHDYSVAFMPLVSAPIAIGELAWITADVFVGPGVSVGEGAVVTARSSVFTDIEPWVVAGGNPAVVIKPRVIESSSVEAT